MCMSSVHDGLTAWLFDKMRYFFFLFLSSHSIQTKRDLRIWKITPPKKKKKKRPTRALCRTSSKYYFSVLSFVLATYEYSGRDLTQKMTQTNKQQKKKERKKQKQKPTAFAQTTFCTKSFLWLRIDRFQIIFLFHIWYFIS